MEPAFRDGNLIFTARTPREVLALAKLQTDARLAGHVLGLEFEGDHSMTLIAPLRQRAAKREKAAAEGESQEKPLAEPPDREPPHPDDAE